ncbi:hypothetical protein LTR37_019262 [Vermiconidia calcicola]|uniref:Uncharacterized protein n=1 Tax=Vermiconidia calcicola TaxID=1690605 RepID=A0ACC3MGJ2_9PEZI|nr:hypothetical protein LTR37_019262 [Vermiconidia calcicola]
MSYDYRRTTTRSTGNRPGHRSYLPPPPPPSSSRGHSVLGYWVPVIVTGTLAIGGLAAWIWSERSDADEDDRPYEKPPRPPPGVGTAYASTQGGQQGGGVQGAYSGSATGGGGASSHCNTTTTTESRDVQQQQQQYQAEDGSWYGRIAGTMRRTPSPQQFFDSASKQVTAGVAAAGAALGSIIEAGSEEEFDERRQQRRETREEGFSDHERWSEEADERVNAGSERRARSLSRKRKGEGMKSVAVVVSADTSIGDVGYGDDDADYRTEHAVSHHPSKLTSKAKANEEQSILSHLPTAHNRSTTDLFILIYAPGLTSLPPVDYRPNTITTSRHSTPLATPGSELQSMSPRVDAADAPRMTKQFDALYAQALALVSSPTRILPFTTRDGYVHILRHLAPQLVYLSDTLAGSEGESIAQLKGWVGHSILVAGDEGHGGLADTSTETEDEGERGGRRKERRRWYEDSPFVGLGKEVEVVDAVRVGEDWSRRVGGRE